MPTTPEPPDAADRPSTADASAPANRDTVPVDPRPGDLANRETVRVQVRPPAPEQPDELADRETVQFDPRRPDTDPHGPDPHRADADAELRSRPTVVLPRQRRPGRGGRAPLPVAVLFATAWAAVVSYLPVAVVLGLFQLSGGSATVGGAAGLGLAGWLLGHGVPLETPGGPVGLAPLLLTVLIGWRLIRAGVHLTRALGARRSGRIRDALRVAGCVGLVYGGLGALAAWGAVGASVPRAGVTLAVVGAAFALVGALRCTDAIRTAARAVPRVVRHGVRAGVVAGLLVLAAGAGMTGLSVAMGGGHAADLIAAYRTGVAGQAGITVVSLAYAPNAAAWAAAYLLGPGFLVGAGTDVSLTDVMIGGPLPAVPLVAGLPDGPVGGTGVALLLLPVAAGAASGWLLVRRLRRNAAARAANRPHWPPWWLVLGSGLLAGPVAGAVLAVAGQLSGGFLGDGRLAAVGPVAWQVGAMATLLVGCGALLGAAATRAFGGPAHR
jgi:hypothetical protein